MSPMTAPRQQHINVGLTPRRVTVSREQPIFVSIGFVEIAVWINTGNYLLPFCEIVSVT